MADWMPIESAPQGVTLLLFHPATHDRNGVVALHALIRTGYVGQWPNRKPTHWMKLPEPPK